MEMNKRIWAAALAAAVTLTSAAVIPFEFGNTAQAAATSSGSEVEDKSSDGRTTVAGFTFRVSGNEATITGYHGAVKDLTIPTKITYQKPNNNNNNGSSGGNNSQKPDDAVTYEVTGIADDAFSGNIGITKVTMSGGINADGKAYGIRSIGERAFFACHDLADITIASTTTSIGDYAFSDCVSLNTIKVLDGNQRYKVVDGALYYYTAGAGTGLYTLLQYPLAKTEKEYKVPDAVSMTLTDIGKGAFWGSESLETITLPDTVNTVGDNAFTACRKLKTVTLPSGLKTIGTEAFRGDALLDNVTLPDGVTVINNGTFQGCESLKTLKLSDELKIIGNRAFQGCKALTEFTVPASVTTLGDSAFAQCEALRQITIPMRTTSIGSGVFTGTAVTVLCHNGSQAAVYAAANGLTAERTYTVGFYTNSTYSNLIASQEVVEGKDAVPPQIPEREGYRMSWSGSYAAVRGDTRVYQVWNKLFNVTFVDTFNDKTEVVPTDEGKTVVPPAWTMSGYTAEWDKDLTDPVTEDFTVHVKWRSNKTGETLGANAVKPAKKGTQFEKGNNKYQVSSANADNPTVKFIGLVKAEVSIVNIPEVVSYGGVTYKVTLISANCVKDNKSIRELVVGKNMTGICAKAFNDCKNLSKIKLKSKSIVKMNNKAFKGVSSKAVFYTYHSQITKYKTMLKNAGVKKPSMKRL
jgi:hypothetical protein